MGVRYILALVLMIAVMIGWSLFFGNRFAPQPEEPAPTETPTGIESKRNTTRSCNARNTRGH